MLVKASQPFVPPVAETSRVMRTAKPSAGLVALPMPESPISVGAAGAYQGRPSAASSPNAAARMNRTLERNPIVCMTGGSISAPNARFCSSA